MNLIDKDAVAEIEKIREHIKRLRYAVDANCIVTVRNACECLESSIDLLVNSIGTLEVKEVDLDYIKKELDEFISIHKPTGGDFGWGTLYNVATHFFELGVRVNNPITAADRGTVEEIIINLKRVEQDYRINLTKEMEWLRNKVKKGE